MNDVNALVADFQAAADRLRDAGACVVSVVGLYRDVETSFSTRLCLTPNESMGLTDDHIVMDSIREISREWHLAAHSSVS